MIEKKRQRKESERRREILFRRFDALRKALTK